MTLCVLIKVQIIVIAAMSGLSSKQQEAIRIFLKYVIIEMCTRSGVPDISLTCGTTFSAYVASV